MSQGGDYKPVYMCPPWTHVIGWLEDNGYIRGRTSPAAILYYNPRALGPPLLLYMDLGARVAFKPRAAGLCAATPWGDGVRGSWVVEFDPGEASRLAGEALGLLEGLRPRIVVLALHLAPGHCYSVRSVAGWTPLVVAQPGAPVDCTSLGLGPRGALLGF
ncbi:MAG: hypothetical protein GSR78_01935 [Desulfurococcales archaeon]|nr:hypothetical protein [Desulfurococcales archaeon]